MVWLQLAVSSDAATVLVGVFGATISLHLFFWQASEPIEDMRGAEPLVTPSRGRRIQIDFGQCDLTAQLAI